MCDDEVLIALSNELIPVRSVIQLPPRKSFAEQAIPINNSYDSKGIKNYLKKRKVDQFINLE